MKKIYIPFKSTIFLVVLCVVMFSSSISVAVGYDPVEGMQWTNMDPVDNPGKKTHLNVAFDESAGKLILFSGRNFNGSGLNDTWAYDFKTNIWENRNPSMSAPGRQYSDMTYISGINKSAVFGGAVSLPNGATGGLAYNDFWLYDYHTNSWEEVQASNPPPKRNFHSLAYSPIENKLVVSGGETSSGTLRDAWAYDFDTEEWTSLAPMPHAAFRHSLVYYPLRETMILFNYGTPDYILELNLTSNTWSEIPTTNSPGTPKSFIDVVYNPQLDKFTLFGGLTDLAKAIATDETWFFDYNTLTWYFANTTTRPPSRHTDSNVEFDTVNNVTIMYGGSDERNYYGDTWALSVDPTVDILSLPTQLQSSTTENPNNESTTSDTGLNSFIMPLNCIIIITVLFRKKTSNL